MWFSYPTALDPAVSDQRESRRGLREQTVISNSNTRLENGLTGVMSENPTPPQPACNEPPTATSLTACSSL